MNIQNMVKEEDGNKGSRLVLGFPLGIGEQAPPHLGSKGLEGKKGDLNVGIFTVSICFCDLL